MNIAKQIHGYREHAGVYLTVGRSRKGRVGELRSTDDHAPNKLQGSTVPTGKCMIRL